ncbi:hypothetical protein BHM03_00029144 [Ensete ventricosum]|nr:hypothetical protein BHM03_00029144 [Ensete ventricosum]
MPSGLTFPLPLSSRINGGNVHLVSPPYLRPPRESPRSASSTPSIPPPFPTSSSILSANPVMGDRVVQDLLAELERAKQLAREERRKAGIAVDGEDEDEEDYMGFVPLIEKLGKMKVKDSDSIDRFWVPTDSESDDDEKFSPDEVKKRLDEFEKKCKRHSELFKNFAVAVVGLEEDDEDFSETKEKDNILIEKFSAIEEKLEEKLAELDRAFERKAGSWKRKLTILLRKEIP